MPGPQALRPAQDWLLRLAWHELAWLVPLALLSELEAHVKQGWFEDRQRTKRSWLHNWLGARQQTASGQQASPGPQRGVLSTVMAGLCPCSMLLFSMMVGAESCRCYFCVDPG